MDLNEGPTDKLISEQANANQINEGNEVLERKMTVLGDEQSSVTGENSSGNNGKTVVSDNRFLVIADLQATDAEDLSITSGEVLSILATRPDGWWLAKNSEGKTGLVPKTFLKLLTALDGQRFQSLEQQKSSEKNILNASETSPLSDLSSQSYSKKPTQTTSKTSEFFDDDDAPNKRKYSSPSQEVSSSQPSRNLPKSTVNGFGRQCSTSGVADWEKGGLGSALESDIHLTCECHLAPRLSESNLGFHDIYWNCDSNKLRKRRVRVSKLVRINKLENVPSELTNVRIRLLRVCLFDISGKTGKQIVSNVHTIKAADRGGKSWNFVQKECGGQSGLEFSEFFVRSNYLSEKVVLMVEATIMYLNNDELFEEEPLGYATLPIVNKVGDCILTNRVYTLTLTNEVFQNRIHSDLTYRGRPKVYLKISDFPKADLNTVDSLPDVIVWNPQYVRMAFCYRRLLGELLIKFRNDTTCAVIQSLELIADPFLSTFPQVADQPDLISLLKSLWNIKIKTLGNKITEEEEALEFKAHYMRTAFVIHKTLAMPKYNLKSPLCLSKRHAALKSFVEQYCLNQDPIKFLAMEKCKPVNLFDLAVDLVGEHAID